MLRRTLAGLLCGLAMLCAGPGGVLASDVRDWVLYSEEANGDLYFYDRAQVEEDGALRLVWNGTRYKTSLMGAFSRRSLLEIDCAERTEKTLQSTFFSDENWEKPAMGTDRSEKPSKQIEPGSSVDKLSGIVCD